MQRFKLPDNVSAVSVEGVQYTADDNGFIDVPVDLSADALAALADVGAKPFAPEHAAQMKADEVERDGLYAHLGELGVPVDRRRRYSLQVLRDLRDDAIQARDEAAAKAAQTPADPAPGETPGGEKPPGEGQGDPPAPGGGQGAETKASGARAPKSTAKPAGK